MTPLLTLWLSDKPKGLKFAVGAGMTEGGYKDMYRPMDVPAGDIPALRMLVSGAYREMIGLDASDTVLHTALIVSLWEKGVAARVGEVIEALGGITNRSSFEIIGLQSALCVLDGESPTEAMSEQQKTNIEAITEACSKATFHCCLCVIDNYIATGASARFNMVLFSKFLCYFLRVMMDAYADVFNPLIAAGGDKAVVAPGLSCLEFRRDKMVGYLLHRSFIAALDKAGIMQEKVDAQGAAERAYARLRGCDKFYSDFYTEHVEPLVNAKLAEGDIAAKIRQPLDEAVAGLKERLSSFMNEPNLSLPDKEATWAIILGRDNARLSGSLYKQKELSFDDVYTEPTELFIDAFNSIAPGSGMLPERGNYPDLAYPEEEGGEPNPENLKAFNPLPQINRIKSELLDITSYLRAKEKELEILRKKSETENIVRGHLTEEGFESGGELRHLEHGVVEQPLKDVYTPAPGLKIRESVDLRKFFSPIRDQGQLGSCSSFSVIAVYESILNRNSNAPTANAALSERFLFYHTNVRTGRIEEGSNFFEQLEAMGKYGTCSESAYPYTTSSGLLEEPSQSAVEEAFKHRVLMARQIPLKSDGNKYDCISANHKIITSALSEGYPVALSLKIFDDFGKGAAGHVGRPTDEQIASGGSGNHAMVIVGFSERDKCYIVRNSWGLGFGDKGYCYVSASYIDDPDLNNFCCIITDTTDGPAVGGEGKVPGLVAAFGGTETEIKIASISNAVDEARIHYTSLNTIYEQLYAYYSDLQERLSQPFVRNDIRAMAERDSANRLSELITAKNSLISEFPKTLKDFCRKYIANCIKTAATTLGLAAIVGTLNYVGINNDYTTAVWILTAIMLVVTIGMIIHYKWAKRKKRMELQEEVDNYALREAREHKRLMEMQMHFHVGGLVLDAMHLLQLQLDNDYDRLVSFNNNLVQWHKEDSEKVAELDTSSEAMFVNLTDAGLLDKFFERNSKDIVGGISLLDAFETYQLSTDSMQEVRTRLSDETSAAIARLFDDFSMIDYLQQRRHYEYMPPVDLDTTLKLLNRMANVLTRHNDESRTYESKFSLIKVPQDRMASWRSLCQPHFDFIPMPLTCSNPDILMILTIKKLDTASLV